MLVLICFEFCPLYRDTCTYILNVVISSTKQLESRPSYRTIHKNSSKHHNKDKKGVICVYKHALLLFNLNLFVCDVVIAASHSFVYSNRKSYFRSQSYTWLHTVYYVFVNTWVLALGPCSRSVLITFTVRVTKQHPVNISFLNNKYIALNRHNRFCRLRIEIKPSRHLITKTLRWVYV